MYASSIKCNQRMPGLVGSAMPAAQNLLDSLDCAPSWEDLTRVPDTILLGTLLHQHLKHLSRNLHTAAYQSLHLNTELDEEHN